MELFAGGDGRMRPTSEHVPYLGQLALRAIGEECHHVTDFFEGHQVIGQVAALGECLLVISFTERFKSKPQAKCTRNFHHGCEARIAIA